LYSLVFIEDSQLCFGFEQSLVRLSRLKRVVITSAIETTRKNRMNRRNFRAIHRPWIVGYALSWCLIRLAGVSIRHVVSNLNGGRVTWLLILGHIRVVDVRDRVGTLGACALAPSADV